MATRRKRTGYEAGDGKVGRALVIHPHLSGSGGEGGAAGRQPTARLAEATSLARAIGLSVVRGILVPLRRRRPGYLLGAGVVDDMAGEVAAEEVDVVIVDATLTPVQQRNLEKAWNAKVIDRTALILEIFGARAMTREGTLQVELAHLTYQKSRLVRSWTHLERQRGGLSFVGGPGESQIEIDRRLIGERIARLKRDLAGVKRTRELHRSARRRVPYPVVALVGYTNAGKSTLFNRLTEAGVAARDQLFATLDPTMRRLTLPSGRDVILSDTVGFISELPTDLVAAFRATLEEVRSADLLLHVRDVAHPESAAQKTDVEAVLADLGIDLDGAVDLLEVLNKVDLLDADEADRIGRIAGRNGGGVLVSALGGDGTDDLLAEIDRHLGANAQLVDLDLDSRNGAAIAWLYDHGEVVSRSDKDLSVHMTVRLEPRDLARFQQRYSV